MNDFYRALEIAKNPQRHAEFKRNLGKNIYVEVAEDVFTDIMAGDPGKSCNYGNLRVYKAGTAEKIDKEESLSTNQKLHGSIG